jgi:hypothetical protein
MAPPLFQALRGIFGSLFQLGKGGPQIRASGPAIEARDATDAGFAVVRGLTPSGPDDMTPRFYADALAGLPPPRVRQILVGQVRDGRTRRGETISCYGSVFLSTDGIPRQLLTEPAYRAQFELGRYVSARVKRTRTRGYVQQGQGFYHPSPWIDGQGVPGSGGTRGGGQTLPDPSVNRPSEWPLLGLMPGGGIALTSADVFAPWCEIAQMFDMLGGTTKTLNFRFGHKQAAPNRRAPGYYSVRPRGVFAFRYSFFNPATKLWIPSAWSEPVFARPKAWPVILTPEPATSATYPKFRAVGPETPSQTALAFTVGGKVR